MSRLTNRFRWKKLACAALMPALLLASPGCSRTFWREQADDDSYLALTEKLTDPRWAVPRIEVTPDPRSRFYDPYDPDAAPLPPDDPAAHVYMHWVDGWEGYKCWHKFGDMMTVENPQWLAQFGFSTDDVDPLTGAISPPVPELTDVTLTQAVELAQLHNRDYQFQIEEVFLTALAVTFQRFQFGVRYLGSNGVEPTVNSTTTIVPHGPGDNTSLGIAGGISQLLPAGTQWAVEFANNTIWLFGGGSETSSISNLSFSIVQPLLFGAGRIIGLEGLTQAERNLLYEARDLARLRQVIFTDVVGGSFGFLSLLQQSQTIRNQRGNIGRLEEQVERLLAQSARNELFANAELQEWPQDAPALGQLNELLPPSLSGKLSYDPDVNRLRWAARTPITDEEVQLLRNLSQDPGFQRAVDSIVTTLRTRVSTLDVLQLQSSLASSVNNLRAAERSLQDNLDSFKILLGLPPDMKFTIDDTLLLPFEIIDPRIVALEEEAKDFVRTWGQLDETEVNVDNLRGAYVGFMKLVDDVLQNGLEVVVEDMERVKQVLPQRLEDLPEDAAAQLKEDILRAQTLLEGAKGEMTRISSDVREYARGLREDNLDLDYRLKAYEELNNLREDLIRLTQNLTVIQVSLRVELIEIQAFEMGIQEAVQVGLNNRVDLMNSRALVMDARRKVEVAANALLATLNVVAEADFNTPPGTKPFDFRGERSRLRAGFSFTAPLDQINERNAYRAALVQYQRERRDYMLAEDRVKQDIRDAWRQMFVLRQNLETSRRAVRIAALQYDSAVEQSNAPVSERQIQAGGGGSGRSGSGSGLAGNNLLNALNAILNAQNQLVQNWTNYERNRLNIYRDMGIMEVGEDGLWNDPFYRSQLNDQRQDALGQPFNLGPDCPPGGDFRGSSLGGGSAAAVLVEIPDRQGSDAAIPQEPDPAYGASRPVFGEPQRPGLPGQP